MGAVWRSGMEGTVSPVFSGSSIPPLAFLAPSKWAVGVFWCDLPPPCSRNDVGNLNLGNFLTGPGPGPLPQITGGHQKSHRLEAASLEGNQNAARLISVVPSLLKTVPVLVSRTQQTETRNCSNLKLQNSKLSEPFALTCTLTCTSLSTWTQNSKRMNGRHGMKVHGTA
jgi:hypothetical protein